ncbi:MAG: Gldg family protein [Acidobacteriota bacterium]|mgnify:FL=1
MVKKLAGIIGWIGTALVFAAVAIRFLRPEWDRFAYWGAWAGLVCVLLYTFTQWREIASGFSRRQTRMGTLTITSIAIVLGILAAINYIGTRQTKRWDLTASNEFTLSDQTVNVLKRLNAPLAIKVFEKTSEMQRFRDALAEYEHQSKHVSIEYADADKKAALARQYQVTNYGTVVLEYQGRVERVVGSAEQDLTNGIIKVISGTQRRVYFVQGHGERDINSSERSGYGTIKSALERENYGVDKLVLIQQGQVPDDAAIVVVAGPKNDLLAPEVDALKRYLAKGGKLMVMLDPPDTTKTAPLANIEGLLHDWGFQIGTNVVVDASGMGQMIGADAATPVAASYPSHPITDRFGSYLTAYPVSRSMGPVTGGINGHTPSTFIETSARSWAETDIDGLMKTGEVKFDEGKDQKGPVSIAAAVSASPADAAAAAPASADQAHKTTETRVVALGDSDFVANAYINVQGNRDMFMNILGWLSQQENLISIRPRESSDRRITLTADQGRRMAWFALLIIPGLIIALGIYTWWRRR